MRKSTFPCTYHPTKGRAVRLRDADEAQDYANMIARTKHSDYGAFASFALRDLGGVGLTVAQVQIVVEQIGASSALDQRGLKLVQLMSDLEAKAETQSRPDLADAFFTAVQEHQLLGGWSRALEAMRPKSEAAHDTFEHHTLH